MRTARSPTVYDSVASHLMSVAAGGVNKFEQVSSLGYQMFSGRGVFCTSQNSKCQDLPKFQFSGVGGGVFCTSQNSKCQD